MEAPHACFLSAPRIWRHELYRSFVVEAMVNRQIRSWQQFGRHVRSRGCDLLRCLGNFHDPILVAGCQRSGTTAVARVMNRSDGMVDYRFGKDDELDAALILSGSVEHRPRAGRYCFQTTYVNECYQEYLRHQGAYRLLWVLREPHAVVYSMINNWGRFALNELFDACGQELLDADEGARYRKWNRFGVGTFRRACLSYNGKVSQLFRLVRELTDDDLLVVDYTDVVGRKEESLPRIFEFVGMEYKAEYGDRLHAGSLARRRFGARRHALVETWCKPVYERAQAYLYHSRGPLAGAGQGECGVAVARAGAREA